VIIPLLSLVGLGVIGLLASPPLMPPGGPTIRALLNMRICERFARIPAPTDPSYEAIKLARYPAYVRCMLDMGYTPQTMP